MFCGKRSLLLMVFLVVTAAWAAQAIEVPVIWFEDDFERYPDNTMLRSAAPNWTGQRGLENRILTFGGDQAVRLKGSSDDRNNSEAYNTTSWAAQSAGNFQILAFTLQSDLSQQSNVGNHLYVQLNDEFGGEMGRWYGWSHAVTPRVGGTIGAPVNITDGAVHDFAITYDPATGEMEWLHNSAVQWTQNVGTDRASERVHVQDTNRDLNDYVWLDDVVAGTVLSGLSWDGDVGSWASANWNTGNTPDTGMAMVIDAASGDSDVTVDADFDSALSVAIGQNNTARVAVDPGVTLTVDEGVTLGTHGTLQVDGTLAAGSLTTDAGSTLGGHGSIHAETAADGILAPGSSTGVLTFQAAMEFGRAAVYQCDIAAWDISTLADPWDPAAQPFGPPPADPPVNDLIDIASGDMYLAGRLELTALTKLAPMLPHPDPPHVMVDWYGYQNRVIASASGDSSVDFTFDAGVPQPQPESWDDIVTGTEQWSQGHIGRGVFLTRNNFGGQEDVPGISYANSATTVHLFQACDGDTNGDGNLGGRDIQNIQSFALFGVISDPGPGYVWPPDWPQGDFDGNGLVDGLDVSAILATGLWPTDGYAALQPGTPPGGVVDLIFDPATGGLVIDPKGLTINGYVIRSEAGVFTGGPAANLGWFVEQTDRQLSGNMGFTLSEPHVLGDVVGPEWDVIFKRPFDRYQDFTFTYTVAGTPGTFVGNLIVVPEPGTITILITGVLGGLAWAWRRRRR